MGTVDIVLDSFGSSVNFYLHNITLLEPVSFTFSFWPLPTITTVITHSIDWFEWRSLIFLFSIVDDPDYHTSIWWMYYLQFKFSSLVMVDGHIEGVLGPAAILCRILYFQPIKFELSSVRLWQAMEILKKVDWWFNFLILFRLSVLVEVVFIWVGFLRDHIICMMCEDIILSLFISETWEVKIMRCHVL